MTAIALQRFLDKLYFYVNTFIFINLQYITGEVTALMETFVKDNLLELRQTLWNSKYGIGRDGISHILPNAQHHSLLDGPAMFGEKGCSLLCYVE